MQDRPGPDYKSFDVPQPTAKPKEAKGAAIKISLFTHKTKPCHLKICDVIPFSHIYVHSSVLIEHVPSSRDYYVSFGDPSPYQLKRERLNQSIRKGYYKDHLPIVIMAYEEGNKTFKNFKHDYEKKYGKIDDWNACYNNCSDAASFAIHYFPRLGTPVTKSEIFVRFGKKLMCGVFGNLFGLRACPTLPGAQSPTELEIETQALQLKQQSFFTPKHPSTAGPSRQQMIEEEHDEATGAKYKKIINK